MELKHNVFDTDTHFKIDGLTRQVKNVAETKTMLVQYDHNSERFTFEVPRFVDDHDLSLCDVVRVHYINIGKTSRTEIKGVYEVTDNRVSPDDDNVVLCSWLISNNATQLVGSLYFVVQFACVKEREVIYSWNTARHTGVTITDGIYNGEELEETYADALLNWYNEWVERFTSTESQAVNAVISAKTEAIDAIEGEILTIKDKAINDATGEIETIKDQAVDAVTEQVEKKIDECGDEIIPKLTEDARNLIKNYVSEELNPDSKGAYAITFGEKYSFESTGLFTSFQAIVSYVGSDGNIYSSDSQDVLMKFAIPQDYLNKEYQDLTVSLWGAHIVRTQDTLTGVIYGTVNGKYDSINSPFMDAEGNVTTNLPYTPAPINNSRTYEISSVKIIPIAETPSKKPATVKCYKLNNKTLAYTLDANGIKSIKKTDSSGRTDTYTITLDDGTKSTFEVKQGERGEIGAQGARGYSAYEIAKQKGFEGTEEQWLQSLEASYNSNTITGESIEVTDCDGNYTNPSFITVYAQNDNLADMDEIHFNIIRNPGMDDEEIEEISITYHDFNEYKPYTFYAISSSFTITSDTEGTVFTVIYNTKLDMGAVSALVERVDDNEQSVASLTQRVETGEKLIQNLIDHASAYFYCDMRSASELTSNVVNLPSYCVCQYAQLSMLCGMTYRDTKTNTLRDTKVTAIEGLDICGATDSITYIPDKLLEIFTGKGVEGYEDTIDFEYGIYTKFPFATVVLDGTEPWETSGGDANGNLYGDTGYFALRFREKGTVVNDACICSHVDADKNMGSSTKTPGFRVYSSNACDSDMIIMRDGVHFNVYEWKAYLAEQYANGTPVTIMYMLNQEPEYIDVSEYIDDTFIDLGYSPSGIRLANEDNRPVSFTIIYMLMEEYVQ